MLIILYYVYSCKETNLLAMIEIIVEYLLIFCHYFGLLIFAIAALYGCFRLLFWLLNKALDITNKFSSVVWNMIEYAFYKPKFKQWMKDNDIDRHPEALKRERK